MLGAIIGDIVGSPYEFGPNKSTEFPLFQGGCAPTDDSIMTIAVGCACVEADIEDEVSFKSCLIRLMKELGRAYPDAGYGEHFYYWLKSDDTEPYHSFGNGSAMRVSPVAWVAESLSQALTLARWSAEVTHDHAEGIKGAEAVAAAIYLARKGKGKNAIKDYIEANYYPLDFTLDDIRPTYRFDVTCQGSVPQAIECFLESRSFEDAIRLAVSLGGDSDTQAAIAGSIAEAFYGIPEEIEEKVFGYIDEELSDYYWSYADKLYE
ncbi:MAG: ADP-ribosylglycohydrolase family protein [Clostridia bacterium]|nr:ADP-ribosylglycohydrolase family protein [Clostridia bacterium]